MDRLDIQKTYKLFIGGKFPRTESGRFYPIHGQEGELLANLCLASRKDLRNAVVAARKAQAGWQSATAYNRGQILYRLAEMLETRREAFVAELISLGSSPKDAKREVDQAIDTLVYYAGWSDKYTALFSSVNPTASAHFNFSVHEAMGVIGAIAPENSGLIGLVRCVAPVIVGGNSVIVLASKHKATSAISFAEVIQNSDVPGGVVNVLTGDASELLPHFSSHMDINGLVIARDAISVEQTMPVTESIKRLARWNEDDDSVDPYKILDLQEVKTTWHPVQVSAGGSGGY